VSGFKKFTKSMLKNINIPSINKDFNVFIGEKQRKVKDSILKVGEDEIFIGYGSSEFVQGNEIVLNLNLANYDTKGNLVEIKSRDIVVIGVKGTGKSVTASIIMESIIKKQKMHCLIIDPAGEFYKHKEEWLHDDLREDYKYEVDEWFNSVGLKREGLKMCVIAPKLLGEMDNVDVFYSINFVEFIELFKRDSISAISILSEILGISESYSNIDFLYNVLSDKIIMTTTTWNGFKRRLHELKRTTNVESIFNSINIKIRSGILNDDEQMHIDLMNLFNTNDCVIFKGRQRKEENDDYLTKINNAYIKLLLIKIENELEKISNHVESKLINKNEGKYRGFLIVIDEADSYAPARGISSMRERIVQLATKDRKLLVNLILITQSANKLDETLFNQSDFIITSNLNEENAKVFKDKMYSEEQMDLLINMPTEITTSIGTTPSEFAICSSNKEIVKFVPRPPESNFKRN
jgi:DNA helicase HerA-like ATPase